MHSYEKDSAILFVIKAISFLLFSFTVVLLQFIFFHNFTESFKIIGITLLPSVLLLGLPLSIFILLIVDSIWHFLGVYRVFGIRDQLISSILRRALQKRGH